jgi:hypothetical protein
MKRTQRGGRKPPQLTENKDIPLCSPVMDFDDTVLDTERDANENIRYDQAGA